MMSSLRLIQVLVLHSVGLAASAFSPIAVGFSHNQIPQEQREQQESRLFAHIPAGFKIKTTKSRVDAWWQPDFPNPADFRFNYHNLLTQTLAGQGIAAIQVPKTVAIVGGGAAGMTAARELHKCGFSVTIYEASDRIGGRLYTRGNPDGDTKASMELGAMRMPFFGDICPNEDGYAEGVRNSILEYYLLTEPREIYGNNAGAWLTRFPNPGQTEDAIVAGTGIYVNRGLGTKPDTEPFSNPQLIMWRDEESPENPDLETIQKCVTNFTDSWERAISPVYAGDDAESGSGKWEKAWNKIATFYDNMTFHDLALAEKIDLTNIDITSDDFHGDLGGIGMNSAQCKLLYTIGIGDGSWGAFYSISALWFLRCTIFGFNHELQTVEGYTRAETLFPFYKAEGIVDDASNPLCGPLYEGIQGLVEYLFYVPPSPDVPSLYLSEKAKLYTKTSVNEIKRTDAGVEVTDSIGNTKGYDFAIVTTTNPVAQISIKFTNFDETQLPQIKRTAAKTQHFISSCKLFFPLRTKYWKHEGNKIPQVLVTDTYVQDVYALEWNTKPDDDAGVILASYTWEDDAQKFLPFQADELSKLVLSKLSDITTLTTGQDITNYIDESKPVMFQWITQPTYIGCSKLYRAYSLTDDRRDLAYNQNHGKASHLYFCGENYGVEGGWTEPALRSALDAVIQINKNIESTFLNDVDSKYPKWPSTWV